MPGELVPVTEDFTRIGGFIAGCGEASLLVILHGAKGTPTDPDTLGQIIRSAAARGFVGPTGVSTPTGLTQLADSFGVGLTSGDWRTMLPQYAGQRPIIVGVANASAFGGRDSNVGGHYVTVVNRAPNGDYIVSDPNASSKYGRFDTYSAAQFAAARPFWAAVPTNWAGSSSTGATTDSSDGILPGLSNPFSPQTWLDALRKQFGTLYTWLTDPLRILKLIGGAACVLIAAQITLASLAAKVAPEGLELAGTASGQPELAMAGRALKSKRQAAASFAKMRRRQQPKAPAAKPAAKAPRPAPVKKQSARSAQPKTAPAAPKPPPAAPEDEGEPVYMDGRRVGTSKGGRITMDQGKAAG